MRIIEGDSALEVRRLVEEGVQVDSIVTDPPYYLESIVKRFGKKGSAPAKSGSDGRFTRQSAGFHEQTWDAADSTGYKISHDPEFWKSCLDILKPGGFCLAFSSPMTGHRQACAMEDSGFRMHPFIGWAYSTGYPKGHSVSKARPHAIGFEGQMHGTQTLKPAIEPIYVAQKPYSEKTAVDSIVKHGVGAFNIEACRVENGNRYPANLVHDGSIEVISSLSGYAEYFNCFAPYPKANKEDRAGSKHPTVKPVALMRHLIRLVTPIGGTVLDPFGGSGTTAQAAVDELMQCIIIERDKTFIGDINGRLNLNRNLYLDLLGIS